MTDPLLTTAGQFNKVYLAISKPSVVFSALVNQSFAAWDDITEVTWDGLISGAYANIQPHMTLLVGSTAGAWDLGVARIRKAASATKLYIGRQSDVRFANDKYLTVIDDFRPSARQWLVDSADPLIVHMDQDVAYSDQNVEMEPIPVMGPDAVVWLTGANVTHQRNAAASWSPDGHAVTCQWSASGPASVSISGANTATPTFTFTVAGEYLITLVATNATHTSKTTTGHRRTFVFGSGYSPIVNFSLDSLSVVQSEGGASFRITLHDASVLSGTYDMPRVTLFAKDVYGSTEQSFGPIVGHENVIAFGWADQTSVEWLPNHSTMSLDVKGPAFWMQQIDILAAGGLKTGTNSWLYTASPTIDKALWNLLHWRSNIDTIIDVFPSGDTAVAGGLVANNGSLWEQVVDVAGRIYAIPCCDRYGRLCLSIDPQMIPYASRSSIPVTMVITKADWREKVAIEQRMRPTCSQIYMGATDATVAYFSKAPGKMVMRWGAAQTVNNILVASQSQTNQLAGDLLAKQNNQYPTIGIPLRANNRLIDVTPNQYVTLSVAAGDTPLGIVWTAKRLVPRRVTYRRDVRTGEFTTDLECETETFGIAGVTYTPPAIPDKPTPWTPPGTGPFPTLPATGITTIKRFGWDLIIGDRLNSVPIGIVGMIEVPFNCNIDDVKVVFLPSIEGDVVIDIWKCTWAQIEGGVHPVNGDSICASAPITVVDQEKWDAPLTGWTTYCTMGDWLYINVDSVDEAITLLTLAISGLAYQ